MLGFSRFFPLFLIIFCTCCATSPLTARPSPCASDFDVLYKSDSHAFSLMLPRGWAAHETGYSTTNHRHVFFCMNNRGLTDLRVTDGMTRNGLAYDADVVRRHLLPGTVYIDFALSDRPVVDLPVGKQWDDSFETQMKEFLRGALPPRWQTPELTGYHINFARWDEQWSIFLYFREPVSEYGKKRAFEVLGSLKLHEFPFMTAWPAVEAAIQYLPSQANPEGEWPRQTAREGRHATRVSEHRDEFLINFTLYESESSNDTLYSFDYKVNRDGRVWVFDTGPGRWSGLRRFEKGPVRMTSSDFDLDGDGLVDCVCFTSEPVRYGDWGVYEEFVLKVNDSVYSGRGDNLDGNYEIVDIDTTDALKEIAVPESGPSDDYATRFFYYDGRDIVPMRRLPGTYNLKVDGSGVINTVQRGAILHTWFHPARYRLTDERSLEFVKQDLYEMNWPVTLKEELPLRAARDDDAIVKVLLPGDKVTILASDNKRWCLVETADGTRGWFAVEEYHRIVGTGKWAYEVFDGLSFAD